MASIDVDTIQPSSTPSQQQQRHHPHQPIPLGALGAAPTMMPTPVAVAAATENPASTSSSSKQQQRPTTSSGLTSSASAYTQPLAAPLAAVAPSSSSSSSSRHPPSKSATGGQSHSHRPVSAMPTPASAQHRSTVIDSTAGIGSAANGGAGGASSSAAAYADRRASAHPTVPVASSQSMVGGLPQMAMGPPSSIDASFASSAISAGIPVTSPAALAYFAAHPRRQQVHFGSYLLLQTLGEGEFGKVKLGVHKEWGEEVAVKLIKRDKMGSEGGQLNLNGPPKDPAKMTKVEREIQVLKDVRHPNIVRLYEVIESDRFIGIVLEYASGGELFDHILAHKYLKERDACRLFAQLISGVNYLHQKKIVHRDLKLENLLLDRNRNVIITDFGFANDFGERRDDLMATSCGSPCYAAPELVVQDGLYAGSAVDVWSCGVILYAMLAGYLPFDDDPANPEGDNINLLYKYIMATPLSFPDYISAEPRDLLSRMLVPDPQRRITLEGVMAHSWLSPYRELFKFTVDELERAAIEQQTKKRQIYRQQMLLQQQMQEQQRQAQRNGMPSSSVSMATGLAPQQTKAQRHQSATPTYARPSSPPPVTRSQAKAAAAAAAPAVPDVPATAQTEPLRESTNRSHDTSRDVSTDSSAAAAAAKAAMPPPARVPAASKPQRHTIQLEYEDQTPKKRAPADTAHRSPGSRSKVAKKISAPRMAASNSDLGKAPSEAEEAALADMPPAVPAIPVLVPEAEQITTRSASSNTVSKEGSATAAATPVEGSTDSRIAGKGRPSRASTAAGARSKDSLPQQLQQQQRGSSNPLPAEVPFPPPAERAFSAGANGNTPVKSTATSAARPSTTSTPPSASASRSERSASARHRKGMSTDKNFLARLLGTQGAASEASETDSGSGIGSGSTVAPPPVPSQQGSVKAGNRSGSARRKALSLVVGGRPTEQATPQQQQQRKEAAAASKATKDERRLTGRLRLSSTTSQSSRPATAGGANSSINSKSPGSQQGTFRPSTAAGLPDSASPSKVNAHSSSAGPQTRSSTRAQQQQKQQLYEAPTQDSSSTQGASSSAAKKVMDWFRKKSLARGGTFNDPAPLPPLERPARQSSSRAPQQQQQQQQRESASTGRAGGVATTAPASQQQQQQGQRIPSSASTLEAPKVIVTGGDDQAGPLSEGGPSSRSTSGAFSHASASTDTTNLTDASHSDQLTPSKSYNTRSAAAASAAAAAQQDTSSLPTPRASSNPITSSSSSKPAYNENAMRYHLGAVDQSALTSRSPPAVFAEVCKALYAMGIETRKESEEEFKLECVRRRKPNKSALIGATQGLGLSIRTSVFPPSQADYERSAAAQQAERNSSALLRTTSGGAAAGGSGGTGPGSVGMSASPSSSSGFRGFLRRGSQQVSPSMSSVALPAIDAADSSTTTSSNLPATIYGEPRVDGGQEVRFSVEITRIKNLHGLYSLDIRRLRGPLTSYKFLYHQVLTATNLADGKQ